MSIQIVREKLIEILRFAADRMEGHEHVLIVIQAPTGTQLVGCCEESNESIKQALRGPMLYEEDITHLVKGN